MRFRYSFVLFFTIATTSTWAVEPAGPAISPTAGWTKQELKFKIQKPFDLELKERYQYDKEKDTHTFWIKKEDKPHMPPPNRTAPRCEMRILDDFTSGQHMLDADYFITPGTHTCIMQVFKADKGAGVMLMCHPDGTVHFGFGNDIIKRDAFDKWWNLKVACNSAKDGEITIWVDNVLVGTYPGKGNVPYYFKCGAYSVRNGERSEVKIRNLKYWVMSAPDKDKSAPDLQEPKATGESNAEKIDQPGNQTKQ